MRKRYPRLRLGDISPPLRRPPLRYGTIPTDIILDCAHHLQAEHASSTLAALQACSRELYDRITPILYDTLDIHRDSSTASLLSTIIGNGDVDSSDGVSESYMRAKKAFRLVKNVIIHKFPSRLTCNLIKQAAYHIQEGFVFAHAKSVSFVLDFDRTAVWGETELLSSDELSQQVQAFNRICNPEHLCIQRSSIFHWRWYQSFSTLAQSWKSLKNISLHGLSYRICHLTPGVHHRIYLSDEGEPFRPGTGEMFPQMEDSGYHKCIDTWAHFLYEAIVTAAEAERERQTGVTTRELLMTGGRRDELDDTEKSICDLIHRKSPYLEDGRLERRMNGEVRLTCLRFRTKKEQGCHICDGS